MNQFSVSCYFLTFDNILCEICSSIAENPKVLKQGLPNTVKCLQRNFEIADIIEPRHDKSRPGPTQTGLYTKGR